MHKSEAVSNGTKVTGPAQSGRSNLTRLQDSDLQQMTDTGKCLSMHQPYASLLVAGIKM